MASLGQAQVLHASLVGQSAEVFRKVLVLRAAGAAQAMAGLVNNNAHGTGLANSSNIDSGLGMWPAVSMLNHSCRPNCFFAWQGAAELCAPLEPRSPLALTVLTNFVSLSFLCLMQGSLNSLSSKLSRAMPERLMMSRWPAGLQRSATCLFRRRSGGQGCEGHLEGGAANSELHQSHRAAQDPGAGAQGHQVLCLRVRTLHGAHRWHSRHDAGGVGLPSPGKKLLTIPKELPALWRPLDLKTELMQHVSLR